MNANVQYNSHVQAAHTRSTECQGYSSVWTNWEPPSASRCQAFQCPKPNRSAQFNRRYALQDHTTSHTGEKPFQCIIASCGKRFSTSGNMYRHRCLHKLKQLQCPAMYCTRVYTKTEKLMKYYRIHMGSAAYPCDVPECSKSFATAGNLVRHTKKRHCNDASGERRCSFATPTQQNSLVGLSESSGQSENALYPRLSPITSPRSLSNGISDLDLLEVLQCLFEVDESQAVTMPPSL